MNWFLLSLVAGVIIVLTIVAIIVIWKADSPQVYLYYNKGANPTTLTEAIAAAPALGGQIATPAQVQAAQQAGAEWCVVGWASDGNVYFPMQSTVAGCGAPGINKASCADFGNNCGVLVYGKKPSSGTANVLPFNGSQWSQWEWYNPFHQ